MTKIIDLINFHAAYGDQVRLLNYYYDEDQNHEHMRGYVPIRSHRQAFLELTRAQLPDKENKDKVFMLTGSFGTGKSHLCLMLANYFSLKPTDLEMQEFFDNWAKRDRTGAETIRNWRGDGRYFVAPCEFGEARPFEDMILTAIQNALEWEGAHGIILDTHFKGALRQIEMWEKRQQSGEPSGVFDDFLAYLGGDDPRNELKDLKDSLAKNESTAMGLFQETYQRATGQKLSFKTDSLLAILKDLLSNPEFHKRYKGLVILADEFGYALSENRVNLSVFQSFAEMSKDGVAGMQLIFIGTGHRRFAAYGANSQLQIDFRVVQDRVTEVSLESEELEQIIASLVSPKVEDPQWQQEVIKRNSWLLNQMAGGAKKLKLFDYLSEPELLEQIVINIYPMHPMATYCLTKMSQELGSDARSVFAFFRKFGDIPPEGGYSWFARINEISKPDGELNSYIPHYLAFYFKPSINTTNLTVRLEIRDHIRNYLAASEEVRRYAFKNSLTREVDPFTIRVLDLIFVYRVSNVNVTLQTLEYGLNLHRLNDRKILSVELSMLIKNKIIFLSPSSEYEFRHSDMADLDAMINLCRQEVLEQPLDLSKQVTDLVSKRWEPFTEAKGHNKEYLGDKRVRRVFATPQELLAKKKMVSGPEVGFWDYHEFHRRGQQSWNDRYDGIMVYVLCENETEIKIAQQAVKSNNCANIIVGIPRIPIYIRETVLNLISVEKFKETEQYKKLDFQERALVDEILGNENQKNGRVGEFLKVRERYLEAKDLYWYREDGKTHLADPNNEYEPADILMNHVFNKRNQVSHEYMSKAHPKTFPGTKDTALREAVAKLVDRDRTIQIDNSEKENRGEIRYLKIALANEGVLFQVGDYEGNIARYKLESNIGKYGYKYPALGELLGTLKNLKPGEIVNLWGTLLSMISAPYGLGPYSLSIFTACAFRYFGDELRLRINPSVYGYSPTNNPDIIIDVATGRFPSATIERRLITPTTAKLINGVYNLFAEEPAPAGTQQTLSETWQAFQGWWKNRTRLERAVGIYADDSTVLSIVDMLSKLNEDNAGSQSFLDEIKQIYGHNPDAQLEEVNVAEIIEQLKVDKVVIETRAKSIKTSLVKNLSALFNPAGDTYKYYADAIHNWYDSLHPDQKLINADWQSITTRIVLEAVQTMQDIEKMFLETIPAGYGFKLGKVDDWSYDQSSSYVNLFQDALSKIEHSLPKVPEPIWHTSVEPGYTFQNVPQIRFRGSVKMAVTVPKECACVRLTISEDPIQAKQFKTIEKATTWEEEITESCTYHIVTQTSQGDFSKVIRITFTNLDEENKLIAEPALKLDHAEYIYRFRNPVDKHGLVVLLKDIFTHLRNDNRIPKKEIIDAFKEVILDILSNKPKDKAQ